MAVERAVDSWFPTHDAKARHEWGTHVLRRYQDCKNGIRAFPHDAMLVMNGAPMRANHEWGFPTF